ncbi:MAG: hypothetical protein G01um101466_30 [Parcubacteria group bacterium Gr01-1014_66]|nr:MAG: hypothetical protein G01um101466_30 [Parcubacteria group bacterium Gr01-1014_66]
MILYVALIGILVVVLTDFLINIARNARIMQAEREVLTNARTISETVRRVVGEAESIYAPTSRFGTGLGQLSFRVQEGANADHPTRLLDLWVDNGVMKMRREGDPQELALSASNVRITQFQIERLVQDLNTETLQITIHVAHTKMKTPAEATLQIATLMRGRY